MEFSRRGFGAACLGIAVVACTDADRRAVGTGGLGAGGPDGSTGSGSGTVDASTDPDAATNPVDASVNAGACTVAATDVGAPSTYTLNSPLYNATIRMFVVKDANGFYAISGLCTHEGAVCRVSGSNIHCPRHGENYTFNGVFVNGPTNRPLAHYAMCILSNGHLGVVTGTTVAATTRLAA